MFWLQCFVTYLCLTSSFGAKINFKPNQKENINLEQENINLNWDIVFDHPAWDQLQLLSNVTDLKQKLQTNQNTFDCTQIQTILDELDQIKKEMDFFEQ